MKTSTAVQVSHRIIKGSGCTCQCQSHACLLIRNMRQHDTWRVHDECCWPLADLQNTSLLLLQQTRTAVQCSPMRHSTAQQHVLQLAQGTMSVEWANHAGHAGFMPSSIFDSHAEQISRAALLCHDRCPPPCYTLY